MKNGSRNFNCAGSKCTPSLSLQKFVSVIEASVCLDFDSVFFSQAAFKKDSLDSGTEVIDAVSIMKAQVF